MRRSPLFATLAALVVLGVTLAAASCGVPSNTDVTVDGGSRNGPAQGSYGGDQLPQGPEGTGNNVEEFVKRFLEAPAGDWEGAAGRVKKFLSPQLLDSWQPPREITVVRLVNGKPEIKPAPGSEVVLDVKQVGVLTNRGTLEPPTSQTETYTFTVGSATDPPGRLAVTSMPPGGVMLLTDTGLNRWYEPRPIYFWDNGQNDLVPDLRYLPKAVQQEARPNMLIGWLLGGPSDWLGKSVLGLPDGTKQRGNAYKDTNSGRLIVDLSTAASGQGLDKLLAQLCWSLRADYTGRLVLQIESRKQREGSTSDYFDRNPSFRLSTEGAQLFAVAGGVVRRVRDGGAQTPDEVPNVDPAFNKNVRYAAISGAYAALVRVDDDRLRLWVGRDQQGRFAGTSLRASTMSRPVLVSGQDVGYVAAGGKLYQFTVDKPKVTEVTVSQLPGGVTSVALAPDGRRLAVVAGGKPFLVALGGDSGGSTGTARPVPAIPLANLSGISWVNETSLVMTDGNQGRVAVLKVTLDGAVITSRQEVNAAGAVTELVSFPENPVSGIGGRIMIEVDNSAYEVYTSTLAYLPPEKLTGPAPAKGVVPTAPFFME